MLSAWPDQIARGYHDEGVALVWTEPWDGTAALSTDDLAPYFIEICRRIRLARHRAEDVVCPRFARVTSGIRGFPSTAPRELRLA
jgi:hypothetical protein